MLSWACTIHKSQGKALDKEVIDLGTTERCSGMTLVALSRVRKLRHLILRPFSYERLKKLTKRKNYSPFGMLLTGYNMSFRKRNYVIRIYGDND